jgi:spore coat protein U-like protein
MKKSLVLALAMGLVMALGGVAMAADTNTLTVQANVIGTCKITGTSGISFTLDPSSAVDATATGSVTYWCTRGSSGILAVTTGLHDSLGIRYMQSTSTPAEKIAYTLNPLGDNYTGQGKTTTKTLTITGTVQNAAFINAMALIDYNDSVSVTITP